MWLWVPVPEEVDQEWRFQVGEMSLVAGPPGGNEVVHGAAVRHPDGIVACVDAEEVPDPLTVRVTRVEKGLAVEHPAGEPLELPRPAGHPALAYWSV